MKSFRPLAILSVSALLLLLLSCGKTPEPTTKEQAVRLVKTLKVTGPGDSFWDELPGVVDAAQKADLGFRVSGKMEKILVNEGILVEKGQLLAQLDAADYEIQLNSRRAEYGQVNADFRRGQALVEKGLISRSDFDKLKAQNSTAKANLETAKRNLEYTSLHAPFSGQIAKRYVENYEEVSPLQAVFALHDLSSMTIKLDIPENIMIRAREDNPPDLYAIFEEIPGRNFPLAFKEVSTQPDESTNTYEVTLTMPLVDGFNILPGMSVTVRAEIKSDAALNQSAVFIPVHAVLEDSAGRYVYLVEEVGEARGVVERRIVETGRLSVRGVEILSGLQAGDEVVTAGMSKMRPGLEVRLATESNH